MVTQRHNRDHEVDVQQFIENVYKPPDPKTGHALACAKFDGCRVYRSFLFFLIFGDPYQTSLNSRIPPMNYHSIYSAKCLEEGKNHLVRTCPVLISQDEKKVIHYVNDGLNRVLRGNPPPRERPPDSEKPRYENYWQARYLDGIAICSVLHDP